MRIPANLITGIAGAGKTTTIHNLLGQRPAGERWAVLVNDFGAASLHEVARDSGGAVVVRELSAGCICCTAQVELRTALVRLLREARPQRLLIELSSAGRPSAILKMLREKSLAQAVDLGASLCVLDPHQFADPALGGRDDYLEQMVYADILIVNKSDVASSAELQKMREAAARLAGRMIVVTTRGQISATLLDTPARST